LDCEDLESKKLTQFRIKEYAEKANFITSADLIPYENEVGIFYVRYPKEKLGKNYQIVSKEF
jgi:hypothetical protein